MDRSLVEAPKAQRGMGCGESEVSPSPPGRGLGRELDPSPEFFLVFDLKMEHFGAVLKADLMEETRAQLQEEEAMPPFASYWLHLCTTTTET